jgi:5'-3' exonuclease
VEWHDSLDRKNVIRARNFFDKTGYKTPFNFLEGKCLQGDSSDVVPGVGGIGEKGAPEFVAEFGSVRRFWQAVDNGAFVPTKKAHQRLASEEGRAIFRKNFRLMQLLRVQKPDPTKVQIDRGAFDKDAFQDVCFELGFASIANNVDHFTRPFIGAQ